MATIVPATIKFSEFAEQTAAQDDIFVGLKSGANAQFTYAAAPSDATYILQTADSDLTNAQAIGDLASGLLVGTTTTGVILSRTLTGTSNEIDVANGNGISGNPTVGISDNPVIPGTSGISIPSGTTGERIVPSSPNINLRWNTTINAVEYYDHGSTAWEQLAESLPDGPSTSVQYNNGGAFAGSANFTFDGSQVAITGDLQVDNININGNQISSTSGDVDVYPASGVFRASTLSGDITGTHSSPDGFSKVLLRADTGNTGDFDALVQFATGGTDYWSLGLDDSDSQTFKISQSGNLATNNYFNISTGGTTTITGDLQVDNININGNTITSTDAAGNINLTPDTTGDLVLDGLKWPQSDGSAGQTLITDGAAQLSWSDAGSVTVPTVDQTVARFNGTTGALEDSGVTINDSDVMSGVTQLNVDNLRADGNTIDSTSGALNLTGATDVNITSTSGDINLTAGSGNIVAADNFIAGDPGTESSGIDINGTTYDSVFKASDIGGSNAALGIYHRHSTTLQPLLIGAHSNSDTSAHGTVTSGQSMFTVYGAGWTGSHYDLFGAIDISADTSGTISTTSSPGRIRFQVTPDASNIPATALSIANDKTATFSGQIAMSTNKITGMGDPTSDQDAATKKYVDDQIADLIFLQPVRVATTANFTSTYNNGTSGVGATLTATSNGAASIDSTSLLLNDRVLFKNQTTTYENGIYYVSQVGDGSNPAIYTRATDFDEADEINPGDLVTVTDGATLQYTAWLQTATVTTIGTDAITFVQFSASLSGLVTISGAQTITGAKTFSSDITMSSADIDLDGNSVDGGDLGANAAITSAQIDNINIDGNSITATDTNGNVILKPDGTGYVQVRYADSATDAYFRLQPNANTYGYMETNAASGQVIIGSGNLSGSSTNLLFQTASSGTATTRATINTIGNFGIGVVPAYRLDVTGSGAKYMARFSDSVSAGDSLAAFRNTAAVSTSNRVGFDFRLNSSTTERQSGEILSQFTTTTDASRASKMDFKTISSAAQVTPLSLVGNDCYMNGDGTVIGELTVGETGSSGIINSRINHPSVTDYNSYTVFKKVTATAATNLIQITIPATAAFCTIRCELTISRGAASGVGTSQFQVKNFSIGRNGSGSDVVLDALTTMDSTATSTTAGGAQNVVSGATTIVRNGAEANTDPQVVNITVNPSTTSTSNGTCLARIHISYCGRLTNFDIS